LGVLEKVFFLVASVSSIKMFYLKWRNSFLVLSQDSSQHADENRHLCSPGHLPRVTSSLLLPRRKNKIKKKSCLRRP